MSDQVLRPPDISLSSMNSTVQEPVGRASLLHKDLTDKILSAAFAVHSELGPGFLERVYCSAMMHEFQGRSVVAVAEAQVPVFYKDQHVGLYYADFVIEDTVIVEVKAARSLLPEHQAQLLNYLTATRKPVGLLVNFGESSLRFKRLAKTK
jgi:GxxExxY protein